LLRVFYTGGFRGKRQFNWIVGLGLFACILASNFTGYLMPWDQLSYWAVTICTGMLHYVPGIGAWLEQMVRGGTEIGSSTLVIFYALHTSVIPVLLVLLMAWHFWRVRKAGGVIVPPEGSAVETAKPDRVLFLPHLFLRELAVGLCLVALVFLTALFLAAPLGAPGNPGMSPNPAKAPWYFLGLQELLLHLHPVVAVVVLPGLAVVVLLLLPYIESDSGLAGRWFLSRKGRRMAGLATLTALVATPLWVFLDERFGSRSLALFPAAVGRGLLPFLLLLGLLTGFYATVKRLFRASRDESVQALFTLLFVGLVVLTCAGIWFRGAGMQLVWPWEG
jgi:quinol-cytochrome oxidoreductase complex cytochrome b subunit